MSKRYLPKYFPLLRRLAAAKQRNLCFYCERPMSRPGSGLPDSCTAEHLLAVSDGGPHSKRNIVAACLRCNQGRHQLAPPPSPQEYRAQMQSRKATSRS
ncbi:HNH endonuclease [Silanimonas algicola]